MRKKRILYRYLELFRSLEPPEETVEDITPFEISTVVQTKDMDNIREKMDVEIVPPEKEYVL